MISKTIDRTTTTISIASFHEQNQLKKFSYDPPYQRRSVWSDEKQSYFIDSLLRNYPIPPIFLHRKIDSDTGKTSFDVIDGKQRLTAIARFVNNEIAASNEYGNDTEEDPLNGVYFKDLDTSQDLASVKSAFWKYDLPIEYIDPSDIGLIEDIFDRLNRNGEPLKGQELRNAQYHSTPIMTAIDDLLQNDYLKERLEVTDKARMEDREFCSECLFSTFKGEIIGSNQKILDELFEQNSKKDFSDAISLSKTICNQLSALNLDYSGKRISGVSHIYGLWSLALILNKHGKDISNYKAQLNGFYDSLRDRNMPNDYNMEEYKKSMSARTKERFTREKRVKALLAACNEADLTIR